MVFSTRFIGTLIIFLIDLLLIILFKILLKFRRFKNLPFFLYPNYIFAIGVFAELLFFFYASYTAPWIAKLADALVSTVKVFGFDILINDISNNNFYTELEKTQCDFIMFHILRIIAPLITLRAALGIFRDYLTQIKYFFCSYKEAHIFSELNEKSICLAKDIYKKSKIIKPLIIFENINTKLEDADEGLIIDSKSIGALFTKKHILDFHFARLSRKGPSIYLIDNDDHINLNNVTKLYETYKKHKYKFYVFTTDSNAEFFIDALDKKNNRSTIHLINQPQIIAYNLMVEKPLYLGPEKNNSDKISVLVIGAGRIGMECAKTAMWCSRMNKYGFEIRIIDSCDREKEFEKEHYKFKENIENAGIDLNYKFIQTDINSPEFVKCLHSYSNYNYVIIATGNDELTINTALKTKTELIRKRVDNNLYAFSNLPVIVPIILNDNYYELFKDYVSHQEDASIFYPFGVNSEVFSLKNIRSWFIDELAMSYFNIYKKLPINFYNKDYFNEKECNKRSNRAAAVHTLYKLRDMDISFSMINNSVQVKNEQNKKQQLQKKRILKKKKYIFYSEPLSTYKKENIKTAFNDFDLIKQMLKTEHERWTIFSVLDGWRTWPIKDIIALSVEDRCSINSKSHKLEEGKLHGCIVNNEMLQELVNANLPEIPEAKVNKADNKKLNCVLILLKKYIKTQKLNNQTKKAKSENELRDNTTAKFNISNKFFLNDFSVCWFTYDVVEEKFRKIFFIK